MEITNENQAQQPTGNQAAGNTEKAYNKPLAADALRGEDDNLVNAADESEIGPEIYDYGDGGGPDASSSGLRNRSEESDDSDGNSTASSDLDSGAGVGSAD